MRFFYGVKTRKDFRINWCNFIFIFLIPVIGWIISLAGLILIAISVKGLSDKLNEKLIFKNYLTSIILFFISFFSLFGIFFMTIFKFIKKHPEKFYEDLFNFGYRYDFYTHRKFFRVYPEIGTKLKDLSLSLDGKNGS